MIPAFFWVPRILGRVGFGYNLHTYVYDVWNSTMSIPLQRSGHSLYLGDIWRFVLFHTCCTLFRIMGNSHRRAPPKFWICIYSIHPCWTVDKQIHVWWSVPWQPSSLSKLVTDAYKRIPHHIEEVEACRRIASSGCCSTSSVKVAIH